MKAMFNQERVTEQEQRILDEFEIDAEDEQIQESLEKIKQEESATRGMCALWD